MPAKWKLLGLLCILQMLSTAFFSISSFIGFFQYGGIVFLFQSIAFALMSWLSILAINILNYNYPDKPIAGSQKKIFNWLFLLNFLLIAFLFGLVFSEYGRLQAMARLANQSVFSMPAEWMVSLLINFIMLIFQFTILYALYSLRRLIYRNFTGHQFEFESRTPA